MALSDSEMEAGQRRASAGDLEESRSSSQPQAKQANQTGGLARASKALGRSQSVKHPRDRPRASLQRTPSALDRLRRRFSRQRSSFRVAVLGACEVGKSAVVSRVRANTFPVQYEPTFEECLPHQMVLRSRFPETMEFVDTSGGTAQEYGPVRKRVAATTDIYLLVFSVKQMSSLDFLNQIMDELADASPSMAPSDLASRCVLIGNQAQEENVDEVVAGTDDVEEHLFIAPRAVTQERAEAFAQKWGIRDYLETSALTGFGITLLETRLKVMARRVRSFSQSIPDSELGEGKSKRSFLNIFRRKARSPKAPSPIPSERESESPRHSIASGDKRNSKHSTGAENDLLRSTSERHSLRETKTKADDSLTPRSRSKTFSLSIRRSFRRRKNTTGN